MKNPYTAAVARCRATFAIAMHPTMLEPLTKGFSRFPVFTVRSSIASERSWEHSPTGRAVRATARIKIVSGQVSFPKRQHYTRRLRRQTTRIGSTRGGRSSRLGGHRGLQAAAHGVGLQGG